MLAETATGARIYGRGLSISRALSALGWSIRYCYVDYVLVHRKYQQDSAFTPGDGPRPGVLFDPTDGPVSENRTRAHRSPASCRGMRSRACTGHSTGR